jgi:hypothetical protein
LKETAEVEEATGFDPSGSSGAQHDQQKEESDSQPPSLPGWGSTTDDTSLSQGMSVLGLDGLDTSDRSISEGDALLGEDNNAQLEGVDLPATEANLIDMFPCLKPYDIKWALNKSKGHAAAAVETLLLESFMEENGGRRRGIEAFSESVVHQKSRKGKGKGRRKNRSDRPSESFSESAEGYSTSQTGPNKWQKGQDEIEFLSTHTNIPNNQMKSLYHANGASLTATIKALIKAQHDLNLEPEPMTALQAADLGQEFPTIPIADLIMLVEISEDTPNSTRQLAQTLTVPSRNNTISPIQLEFRLPKIDLGHSLPVAQRPKVLTAMQASDVANTTELIARRNNLFNQASAAWRKSKSNPLMSGAAAYYSDEGRACDYKAKSANSAAADQLAALQSTASQVDLHGIGVVDGVRIARERLTAWWASWGSHNGGYTIVVGKGNNSEGGVARLGPAVVRMLVKEGWKIRVESGAVIVTGVMPKRKG